MGQFSNTFFSLLLGWVQTAAAWLWKLVTGSEGSNGFRWMMDHWAELLVLLCLGGVVLDFIVYLFRWQPYRVWRSFFRRLTGKDEPVPAEDSGPTLQRRWIYADGSTAVEDVPRMTNEVSPVRDELDAPIRPVRRMADRATPEQAYNQPVYPPQWRHTTRDQGENE